MKMDKKAGSKNDEWYTPVYAIEPLIKYLKYKRFKTIWCPFDNQNSNFVKVLWQNGFSVIGTHIDSGEDFFDINIDCDCIVSNPPYSCKTKILQRLFNLNKPFAMLLGIAGLFEGDERFDMFKENTFEVMMFDRRIDYLSEDECSLGNTPFSSVYITKDILPKQIIFEEVNKPNKRKIK